MKEHIAETAATLFYENGIGAVGVDRIADVAEVTKRTLYRHFRSKDELIAASLRVAPIARFPESGDPVERILGAFAVMETFLRDTHYRGCPYIFYSAELTDRSHPARRIIERRLARRRAWFRERAVEAGLIDPAEVAEQLDVILDGAFASVAKRGDLTAARSAQRLAAMVVENAMPESRGAARRSTLQRLVAVAAR